MRSHVSTVRYTVVLPVSASPDEDHMSLPYVRHLAASERQFLNIT